MRRVNVLAIVLLAAYSAAQSVQEPLTAEVIMARVAANQDRSDTLRKQYVYCQHIHIVTPSIERQSAARGVG